jgi:hypothetical protein
MIRRVPLFNLATRRKIFADQVWEPLRGRFQAFFNLANPPHFSPGCFFSRIKSRSRFAGHFRRVARLFSGKAMGVPREPVKDPDLDG